MRIIIQHGNKYELKHVPPIYGIIEDLLMVLNLYYVFYSFSLPLDLLDEFEAAESTDIKLI